MNIYLKALKETDGKIYYDLIMKLTEIENVYARPVQEKFDYEDFQYFLNARVRMSLNDNLPEHTVPTNTNWVMLDDMPIGYATLKHYADYKKIGGHTGLTLLPEYQNKGIGTIVSKELELIALNELGLNEIIYTSKDENVQSQKSVDKIGGELVSIHDGYHFYKVDLIKKYNLEERKHK